MATLRLVLLVCVCGLIPASARADDGGWLEWLEKMSGPRFIGLATDFHFLCIGPDGKRFACERWFGLKDQTFEFSQIRHEIDARVGIYWKVGERFSDVTNDTDRINALKLEVMYRYHPNTVVSLGTGAGVMPFFGEGFDVFARLIITPVSVIVTPFRVGPRVVRAFYVRLEDSYIARGFSGAVDFKDSRTKFSTTGEWNTSYGFGWDFRIR